MVCEYEDVFLDELPGLSPHKDVDFIIELQTGTSPISMTPHRMADECLTHSDYTRVSLAFSCCFGIIYIVLGIRSLI